MLKRRPIEVLMICIVVASVLAVNSTATKLRSIQQEKEILQKTLSQTDNQNVKLRERVSRGERQAQKTQNDIRTLQQLLMQSTMSDWKISKAVATAYSPFDNQSGIEAEGDGKLTSIGLTPGPNIIAVDPKKIPYGSEIIILFPNGTRLRGIAGDTGGALRAADYILLDVFKYTYKEACAFGRKDVTVLWRSRK